MKSMYRIMWLSACVAVFATPATAALYENGFESNTTDWSAGVTRVASGTGGINSSSGAWHATAPVGSFTRWGGYNFGAGSVPTAFQEYTTSLDIYLDVDGWWANDTRFAYTSAISNSAGGHLRDFVFSAGFYSDNDGPGAGTNRFVVSASNNSPGWPKDPRRAPISISNTGWYKFEHSFQNNGGVLAGVMSIFDSSSALMGTWTLSDPADLIAGVGGNRYGWFSASQFSTLAIDNAEMVVPEPASVVVWTVLGLAFGGASWFRRKSKRS